MLFLAFYLACFPALLTALAAVCPNGWVPHDESCYFFSKDTEIWAVAAAHCAAMNAELAAIESEREDTFLRNTLKQLHANDPNIGQTYYSIGGTDIASETEWVWAKTHRPFSYSGWAPNEPDSWGDQDCLVLGGPEDFKWNDSKCKDSFNFICELQGSFGGDVFG